MFKNNLVVLYADSLRRDLSTCFILSEILKELGYRTFISSRRNFHIAMRYFTPAKLLLVGQIDMLNYDWMLRKLRNFGTEIFFLPAEGREADLYYEMFYPKDFSYDLLTNIFFWGESQKKWFLRERSIGDTGRLVTVGHARMVIHTLYSRLIESKKDKIGFVGQFVTLNDIYDRKPGYYIMYASEERVRSTRMIKYEAELYSLYARLFDFVFEHTDYTISFRPHPIENASIYEFLKGRYKGRMELDMSIDIGEWLNKCRVVFTPSDDTILDAYFMKVPAICVDRCINLEEGPAFCPTKAELTQTIAHVPETFEEIERLLEKDPIPPFRNEEFDKTIKDTYIGETKIVFDTIVRHISHGQTGKYSPKDMILLNALKSIDNVLAARHHVLRKPSLQFDYSMFFHKPSNDLMRLASYVRGEVIKGQAD